MSYRKKFRATNRAFQTFKEITDIHTEAGHCSLIGIHTPQGANVRAFLGPLFTAFRKYRYLGCDVSLVPVTPLLADPSQIGYEPGDDIDPRDMTNPILFKACHGDSLTPTLNMIYRNSHQFDLSSAGIDMPENRVNAGGTETSTFGDLVESAYYNELCSHNFRKSNLMKGMKIRNLVPLNYCVDANKQFRYHIVQENLKKYDGTDYFCAVGAGTDTTLPSVDGSGVSINSNVMDIFTGKLHRDGWHDCEDVIGEYVGNASSGGTDYKAMTSNFNLPKLYLGLLWLPPSYKQEMYFRMIITHRFAFREFRTLPFASMVDDAYAPALNLDPSYGRQDPVPSGTPSYEDLNPSMSEGDE